MSELTFTDGSVLCVLADSSTRLRDRGGQLVVKNPPAVARKLL